MLLGKKGVDEHLRLRLWVTNASTDLGIAISTETRSFIVDRKVVGSKGSEGGNQWLSGPSTIIATARKQRILVR
ncbi:MAG: hypothetical protein ACLPN1_10715 [Dissulfurispiraceae bacterium]|jgi:hypothetical protein